MKNDIIALIVFFMMGFNLCIPVVQKQLTVEEISAATVEVEPLGNPGDDWLVISSTNIDSFCGEDPTSTLAKGLDGTNYWKHRVNEVHYFILDLGETYSIKKVRGRSFSTGDPNDVNIYISDDKGNLGAAVYSGNPGWQNSKVWVETDVTDKSGRYIKVEIEGTEHSINYIYFGIIDSPWFTIFDVYGDVAGPENTAPTLAGEIPVNTSIDIGLTPVCNVTANDEDGGDTLTVTFYENTTGSWVLQQTNESVSPGASVEWNNYNNATAYSTKYWWAVNSTDGTDWINETYSFTTEAEVKEWVTLDTWNITLGNMSISPYVLDTWNITLGNLTIAPFTIDTWNVTLSNLTISPYTLDTWNVTLSNLSISAYTLDTWNITLSNTTESYILDTWNITLSNLTISPYVLDTWNITLSNTTEGKILDTWNITLGNLTISPYILDTWNLTLGNLTISQFTIDTWNLTLSNATISQFTIDTWNITLSNLSISAYTLDTWNITLSNLTISPYILDTWNITLSNTPVPYTLDTWNITLSNTSVGEILDRWNVTLSNTSFFNITDIKATPSEAVIDDVTINITCNVTSTYAIVNVTLNMTEGDFDMNNIGDLYYYNVIDSTIGTHYYHIYANDTSGDQQESATYSFRIIGLSCSFTYTVNGGLMTLTPTITGATHYQWTLTNETGSEGQTPWIPIGDINKYMQGYIYPTTIRVLLSAKNINFNQYANYSDNVKITKSSFEKPEPTEIIEEEPDLKLKNIYDTGISDWLEDRKPGEFLVIGSLILLVAIILFKKRPKKIVIYTIKKENIGRKVDKILEEKK